MRSIFISQDLWEVVQEGYEQSPKDDTKELSWDKTKIKQYKQIRIRDIYALSLLYRGVDEAILTTIMPTKTATEAWRVLETKYKGSEEVILFKLQYLWREFDNLLMIENETIQSFFDLVTNIIYQIRSHGGK